MCVRIVVRIVCACLYMCVFCMLDIEEGREGGAVYVCAYSCVCLYMCVFCMLDIDEGREGGGVYVFSVCVCV